MNRKVPKREVKNIEEEKENKQKGREMKEKCHMKW